MTGNRLHQIRLRGAGITALPSAAASAERGGVRPTTRPESDDAAIRFTGPGKVAGMDTAGGGQLPVLDRLGGGSLELKDEQKISAQAGRIGRGP
jgi:hypothetical protein